MPIYLGFYLGHDTNVAVSIDGKIKYRKSERFLQEKHHKATEDFVWSTLKEWGINKVDFCAYTDADNGRGGCKENELFCGGILKDVPNFRLDHHYAHSLSLWPIIRSEKIDYAVSVDGKGDWNRSMMIIKSPATNPQILKTEPFPSLGFEFFLMGKMLGFSGLENDLAGKLMGLQSYSDEEVVQFGLPKLLDTNYKNFNLDGYKLTSSIDGNYQTYNEWHEYWWDHLLKIFDLPKNATIAYTGGCAQNSVYNYRLKKIFPNLFIPPHCYDGGLSLGCLEFLRIQFQQEEFDKTEFPFWQDDLIESDPSTKTIKKTADLIATGKIVGWMQGRGELGPRALGHRSILMNATKAENKDILNQRVKKREAWRPYAGSVLREFAPDYFDMDESPYMLYACNVLKDNIPAITHVDGTCRMQTVDSGFFYELIQEYYKLTGVPVVLNTSLNIMGKPIASRAWNGKSLSHCNLDNLVVGNDIYQGIKL